MKRTSVKKFLESRRRSETRPPSHSDNVLAENIEGICIKILMGKNKRHNLKNIEYKMRKIY